MKKSKKRMKKCHEGKQSFETLKEAQIAAAAMAKRKNKQGNTIVSFLQAYRCPCGKFHFGKTKNIDWSKVRL